MQNRASFFPARVFAVLSFCGILTGLVSGQDPIGFTAPYHKLDRVEGEFVSYNSVPRRPMAISGQHLYAVNTHGSTVLDFNLGTYNQPPGITQPIGVFPVAKSPVSIAVWGDKLVVVCDGTYCLMILDRFTGAVLELLELRNPVTGQVQGEPGDLLVDTVANRAFVSCAAADAVLEIDLSVPSVVRRFVLPAKDPVFMCFDDNMADPKDVLVAPMLSGNNSGARRHAHEHEGSTQQDVNPIQHQGEKVVDFTTEAFTGSPRLPDVDLFRCVRQNGAIVAETTGMGTIQFACGINPTTHQIWQLNTEADNKSANQTEASIKGVFVKNRLSMASPPSGSPSTPSTIIDLGDSAIYTPTRAVGQPYSLTFALGGAQAVITGLLTDNFIVLGNSGNFLGEFNLEAGSIPRATLYYGPSTLDDRLLVYCWGTNKVQGYDYKGNMPLLFTLDLGYDPTPDVVKEGRTIFYDAERSLKENASCASCHIEGRTDMVSWNLSKDSDDKGPMVTQTLAGIERMVPFHWRGEQLNNLADFNPAFVNLLGASSQLSPADFAKFERFVFSIQNRPNPFGNELRLVDTRMYLPAGTPRADAMRGQDVFISRCAPCHAFPTGTNNDMIPTGPAFGEENPRRQAFKVAPFHDLYKKQQDSDMSTAGVQTIPIVLAKLDGPGTEVLDYSLLGAGFSHAGLAPHLNSFIELAFNFLDDEPADLTSFLLQWDQGIAPAAYRGVLLDQTHPTTVVGTYLIPQAEERNCDLVVFGTSTVGSVNQPMRWFYNRALPGPAKFVPETRFVESKDLTFFTSQAQAGEGRNVFLGLPVGTGRRFAIDYDGDAVRNAEDLAPTSPDAPVGDVESPVITRHELVFVTGRVARINVETNEPCTLEITYGNQIDPPKTRTTDTLGRTHSVLLNDLTLSNDDDLTQPPNTPIPPLTYTYTYTVEAIDRANNVASSQPTVFPTLTNVDRGQDVIGSLSGTPTWTPGPLISMNSTLAVRVDKKNNLDDATPDPEAGVQVVARVFVDGVLHPDFNATGSSQKIPWFDVPTDPPGTPPSTMYDTLTGPFLLSDFTSGTGATSLGVAVHGLTSGKKVLINLELIVLQDTSFQAYTVKDVQRWNMPATPASNRGIEFTVP